MATKSILKRGFKAKAERLAKEYRVNLGVHPCAPLCAFKLAEHLEIKVQPATDLLALPNEINRLSGANGKDCEWSALTMENESGQKLVLHNPFHSVARQQSDLMHELSHIICKHERKDEVYDFPIPFGMRYYDEEEEEEAKCLGSALQLATPCLLWAKKRNMPYAEIATHFNASVDMVTYRMNMTGIAKRMNFKKA